MGNKRYKVLLIEDNKLHQMAFFRMVERSNLPYDYTVAGSVSKAHSILSSERFDIVILDHSLGDGTAFDVLDCIKDTAVIFVTGEGNEELAVRAMKKGAFDYLVKDIDRHYLKVLPHVIENAIKHKKNQDELKKYHDNLEERTEQLAKEKELLSVTLSSMGDGLIAVDASKRIFLFNEIAEELTQWKRQEAENKAVDEVFRIIDEKTDERATTPIDKVLSSEQIEVGTEHDILVAKDGGECPISITAAPIRKRDGAIIGVVMVFRDVSQAHEIHQMKTDFVSSVSHELRSPLTSIKAYTATILRDPAMPEEKKRQFLTVIDEESTRLSKLIEDLLEVSRIESRTIQMAHQEIDIGSIVERVLLTLKPLAEKKNIQLGKHIAEEIGVLYGDETKLQSVVTNIVNNAIKFTPEEGRINISVEREDEKVAIRVSDTGMGIPKESLPKIFDRFYRVYHASKQIEGTGLGLAISKEIVIMHGGRIEVESEVNKGTTFTIFLPIWFKPKSAPISKAAIVSS